MTINENQMMIPNNTTSLDNTYLIRTTFLSSSKNMHLTSTWERTTICLKHSGKVRRTWLQDQEAQSLTQWVNFNALRSMKWVVSPKFIAGHWAKPWGCQHPSGSDRRQKGNPSLALLGCGKGRQYKARIHLFLLWHRANPRFTLSVTTMSYSEY